MKIENSNVKFCKNIDYNILGYFCFVADAYRKCKFLGSYFA